MNVKSVSIEITNNCNNQCLICPQGHNLINRKGYMSNETFNILIKRLEHIKREVNLELHGIGEPLLHPKISQFISTSVQRGFFTTICTNAILLTLEKAKELHESGLNRIVVSLETKENYERVRCSNIYERVLNNIMKVAENIPEIELEIFMIYVGNEMPYDFDDFKKQFGNSKIRFNQFRGSNWLGKIPFEGLLEKKGSHVLKKICPLFIQYCSINFEGQMRHCYLDFNTEYVIGDMKKVDFDTLWFSDYRKEIIKKMQDGRYDEFMPCAECVFPFVQDEKSSESLLLGKEDFKRPEMQLLSKIKS